MVDNRPKSLDAYGAPLATRGSEYRQRPNASHFVSPPYRGVMSGTPAYDAGAPTRDAPHAREPNLPKKTTPDVSYIPASSTDWSDLPAPYNWDGTGPVPPELWTFCVDLASMGLPSLPAQSDPVHVAAWLQSMYIVFTTPGEGCGLDPQTLKMAIVNNASMGPHQTAYAVQQAIATSDLCAQYIKNPLSPPVTRQAPPTPTGTLDIGIPKKPPFQQNKPIPWGWVLGGCGLLAAVGLGVYFTYRASKKKRKNPCSCHNPVVVEAMGYEVEDDDEDVRENPYGGSRGFTSIDGGIMSEASSGVSPIFSNPSRPKKKRRRGKR